MSTLYRNANIWGSEATSILVRDGTIEAIGWEGAADQVIDLQGAHLLPGFNDAHVHIWKVGQLRTTTLDLRGIQTLPDLFDLIRDRLQTLKPGEWLYARGWNEANLQEKRPPLRTELDQIAPENPILLTRTCAHIHAANSLAFELAGIHAETPSPPGGEVHFEKGLLLETALGLIQKAMPRPTVQDYERWVLAGCEHLRDQGCTHATDPAVDPPLLQAYINLAERGELPIRVNVLYIRRPDGGKETYPLPEPHEHPYLRVKSVKFFADGGLSGATAALSVPYQNTPEPSQGVLRFDTDELYELMLEAHLAGFQIGTHAIGDRTLTQVLGIYQRLYTEHPSNVRHRIEHFGLPDPQHLNLAHELGIIVVPQAIFLRELRVNFERYLPESFKARCYNLRQMLDAGLTVALSSDGPVVKELRVLEGIQAAIHEGIRPENNLTLEEAVEAYTLGGAKAQQQEHLYGDLTPGKKADFVLLSHSPDDPQARILRTILAEEHPS
ncbi:amidohydrolase [Deinococcus cellulosilyticus]|uniref:Amidohydrolase n=1 Tax=Deinococcus cellulosilyticus (strain DSM 18568 / NBRC 106333 / KACC 11606 / 5516J-15) TaxID=1223518 RepID=A0A511N5W0_DEIC1|nr:amidohydrolase [Deinococcus cellulosilyticus]GEM48243.1 amidohydrolase [Deinococcus cellulosilyticus NBRC 106333 = KACC 11606]